MEVLHLALLELLFLVLVLALVVVLAVEVAELAVAVVDSIVVAEAVVEYCSLKKIAVALAVLEVQAIAVVVVETVAVVAVETAVDIAVAVMDAVEGIEDTFEVEVCYKNHLLRYLHILLFVALVFSNLLLLCTSPLTSLQKIQIRTRQELI